MWLIVLEAAAALAVLVVVRTSTLVAFALDPVFMRNLAVGLLVLNLAWTPLFFAAGLYAVALAEIVVLLVVLVATVLAFRRTSALEAWLLVPYVAWTAFATALNAGIVVLN